MGFPRQLSGLHLPAILPTSGSKRARPYTPETGSFQPDPKRRNPGSRATSALLQPGIPASTGMTKERCRAPPSIIAAHRVEGVLRGLDRFLGLPGVVPG